MENKHEGRVKVKSSALGYAIAFLMLTGLICSGVLFIASANKRLEMSYTLNEHILLDNYVSLIYGAQATGEEKKMLIHPAGDTSDIFIKTWGAFRVVTANTRHGIRKMNKSALIGYVMKTELPALYLTDNNQALKLGGSTKIEGEAWLPERGVERAYIAGKNYGNEKLLYGTQKKSDNHLPALNAAYANLTIETFLKAGRKIEFFTKDSTFAFDRETVIVSEINPLFIQGKISGNIILHSFDSIYVSASARLENVILVAPKVRFQEGFQGSVQVISHEKIVCEKHVKLLYPSVLVLNEITFHNDKNASVELQEGARVTGGILLTSQSVNFRRPVYLSIHSRATAGGLVYNVGETELQGKIIGSIFTQNFRLNAGGGVYTNHLLDALISSDRLPKAFLYPGWMEQMEFRNAKIITCF